MHPYSNFTNEISKEVLFNSLVGCGLFADKIPKFLNSKEFLKYISKIDLPMDIKPEDYIRYSTMRNTNFPRPLAIPAPFSYANLCWSLKSNWKRLKKHFEETTKNEKHKVSRIHLRKMKDRCELFQMNYKNYNTDGFPDQELLIKSKYVVTADIAKCFPTIYSHSIPWSLIGRKEAKKKKNPTEWFNKLDFYIRNSKYGETNGLQIGPHSSNLISEIVLTKVDSELVKQGFKYTRHIDDYSCYCKTYAESEQFLLKLSEELRKYELSLNEKKSEIIPLPKASVKKWVNQINHFIFVNTYKVGSKEAILTKDLKGFMDFVIELMLDSGSDAAVLNYAIKIIANKHLDSNAKHYFKQHIHHLVLLYPYLANLLDEFVFVAHKMKKKEIKSIANDLYEYGIESNVFEACSHALFWAMKYDFKIEHQNSKENSIKSMDCIFMLTSYLYNRKNNKKAFLKEFQELAKELKKFDFDRYWLFVYTVLPWSDQPHNYKQMKKDKVSFINKEYQYK